MTREERVDWLCRLRCWVVPRPNMTVEQKSKCIEALTEVIDDLQTEPCEDCISRRAVLSEIETVCFSKRLSKFRVDHGSNGTRDYIINYIKQLPSVQPEPKTGHWITRIDDKGQFIGYKCSKCGGKKIGDEGEWVELIDYKYQYCPNCGAKMEAE